MDGKEPPERAALLPRIVSVTTLTTSAETSGDEAIMDGNAGCNGAATARRVCDGTAGVPAKQPGRSVGTCHECSACGQRFANRTVAKIHLATHICEEPYARTESSQKFIQKSNVISHQRNHTGERRLVCELCQSKFSTNLSLHKHKQLHACGVDFFHCPECSKTLMQRDSLLRHLKFHKMEKPYACDLCPATFVYHCGRNKHVLTHTIEKPPRCPLCQKCFASKKSLKVHMRRIHGEVKTAVTSAAAGVEMVSPSSPPATLPPCPVDMDGEEPVEPAAPLPRITSLTTLTSSTETSMNMDSTDSDPGHSSGSKHSAMGLPTSSSPPDASAAPSPSGEPSQHLTVRQRRQALAIKLLQTSSSSRRHFAMAQRPNSRGSRYCCVVNCHNSEKNTKGLQPLVKFYSFPGKWYEKERRQAWITAVCRFNPDGTQWIPNTNSRICSRHFVGNSRNESSRHPSYVPTIFPAAYNRKALDQDRGQRVRDGTVGAPAKQPGRSLGTCHECSVCGQRFASRTIAKIHLSTHTRLESYTCPDSSQKLVQKSEVDRHQHDQTFEIRFACELCVSTFCTNKSLDRHKQLHARGVDFFHCPECGKTMLHRKSLLRHLKWHKMEKPYQCHLCPATFIYDYKRDEHVLTHSNEKLHRCHLCPKSFVWKSSLNVHMHRIHGEAKTAVTSDTTRVETVSPSSPPATLPPVVTAVNIKVEPSSPPSTLPPASDVRCAVP
ncbi:zinc finger protein 182 isoform X2 [Dermacentor silvarum]|uniref:zinc finger protein 182 isoform X2 n=1 Tax=Dermacentor silvarum TaxID=543639 RepID=UPI002101B584|nr:zinc finger protein 182 isoform X2 [Dermacentor silvarum]XP_049514927.1 zinc finger protein 182 isoform X2 [Dermacentor silvarum]